MAARKHLPHIERTRLKIQTSMLINRLTSFVKGEVDMSAPQVTAALGLIKKTLPDLAAVEHSGQIDTPALRHDLGRLNERELDAVEAALAKSAVATGSPAGEGAAEPDTVH